ncbi:MAG TPA: folylpolyglutamate synthase/dihydrofolate synthase family protein [Thermoplasmata archaeon]|nr:folylpolyglutamate synthase/dihydrofolate synthase family protein [Thermoplasmata archaeon]
MAERPSDYKDAINYLISKHRMDLPYGLEKITSFLDELGNPHRDLRGAIVTGSKGKGSVTAMLHSILRASGNRVGRNTSPHLVRFNERIVVDSEIDDREVTHFAASWLPQIEAREARGREHTLTFFEISTAMAFQHFLDRDCDAVVMEVGMGGRLDATNMLMNDVSVITPIELEHSKVLGASVEEIAREKAAVIKAPPGGKGEVVTSTSGDALAVVEERAKSIGVETRLLGREFEVSRKAYSPIKGGYFDLKSKGHEMASLLTPLHGAHEVENAGVAVEAALSMERALGLKVTEAGIRAGLESVRWPARIQFVRTPPIAPLVLDCAHTIGSARALARTLKELTPGTKYNIIISLLADKDARGVFSELLPLAARFHLCPVKSARAAKEEDLKAVLSSLGAEHDSHTSLESAVDCAEKRAKPRLGTLICGSVYLAGEAMGLLGLDSSPVRFEGAG